MVDAPRGLEPASILRISYRLIENVVEWCYDVDGRFKGVLRVTYPFTLDATAAKLLPAIGLGIAAFLGQLCLARRIEMGFAVQPQMVSKIEPLVEMLYDVRCWKDGIDLLPLPSFVYPEYPAANAVVHADIHEAREPNDVLTRRACLLWSGGKDSTLSALLLRRNGYEVLPVHVTANVGMEESEQAAARHLAAELDLAYQTVVYEFPGFLDLSSAYALNWNRYPLCNTVPFGRDMALALIACPLALREGAGIISMGHEHDCKTAYFIYQGKSLPRNDVESTRGALALESYIRAFILPQTRLLPPLAGLSEYRVLYEMLVNHTDVMSRISFCFWGNNCGQCSKCLRYYLAQRVLGRNDLLVYRVNPLEGDNCPELSEFLDTWRDESTLFRKQMLYGLGRLVDYGDVRPGETCLQRFRVEVYPHIAGELDAMETELFTVYSDPQLPGDFLAP